MAFLLWAVHSNNGLVCTKTRDREGPFGVQKTVWCGARAYSVTLSWTNILWVMLRWSLSANTTAPSACSGRTAYNGHIKIRSGPRYKFWPIQTLIMFYLSRNPIFMQTVVSIFCHLLTAFRTYCTYCLIWILLIFSEGGATWFCEQVWAKHPNCFYSSYGVTCNFLHPFILVIFRAQWISHHCHHL